VQLLRARGQYHRMYTKQFRQQLESQYGLSLSEPSADASAGLAA
jgi:hypothetical protein